ncbi:MAG: ribosome biogenesis GTPase Der [Peptococcaceae bacterium]|nr:ribosome biogenesis GTPase Der [Peptococcaceae bacterium]
MTKSLVAIVGRPNVGKSTLFNRIVGSRIAIVEDTPGITRDRLYFDAEWGRKRFTLIDTGGIELKDRSLTLSEMMKQQVDVAIEEADVVIFVVDGKTGPTAEDELIAKSLRQAKKTVLLVVNKVENFQGFAAQSYEYYALGLGDPIGVSAAHGLNTGDLLDAVVEALPPDNEEDYDPETVKVAVIGRPNVGKSSLVNKLLGEKRVLVSDIPGTTRDAIDTPFVYDDKNYILIDTAGIRRKKRIVDLAENYSVVRSFRAIDRSDVVLMMLDAVEGITDQDKRIAGYAHEEGKGIILVINKWDLIVKDHKTLDAYEKTVRNEMGFLAYAPTQFISAETGQRVNKIMDLVDFVAEQNCRRITTALLNEQLREWLHMNPPPTDKGKPLHILYATQLGVKPPTFIFFVNDPEMVHFSYKRYLINQLRQTFGFEGSPIRLVIRKRSGSPN